MKIHNNRAYMGLLWAFLVGLFLVGCNSEDAFDGVGKTPPQAVQLERIDLLPSPIVMRGTSELMVASGNRLSFIAIGHYLDGSSRTLTDLSVNNWHSSDHDVGVFKIPRILTTKTAGKLTVSVTKDGITSNEVTLTVTAAVITEINITPSVNSIAKGQVQALTAIAIYSDGTSFDMSDSVTWTVADTSMVTVSSEGMLIGQEIGTTTVTALKEGIVSNTVNVTVTAAVITDITVTPPLNSVAKGQNLALTATAIYSDGTSSNVTNSVTWVPSAANIATVTAEGVLIGEDIGNTQVSAIKDGIVSNTISVTVTAAVITDITVTPSIVSVAKGQKQALIAIATYSDHTSSNVSSSVTWLSMDMNVATVSPEGELTGIDIGTTNITAIKKGITSNTVNVNVTPAAYESPHNFYIKQ